MPKRYQGNTGRYAWVESSPPGRGPAPPRPPEAPPHPPAPPGRGGRGRPPAPSPPSFLPKLAEGLETEDLILMLLCYLLYRESGDSDWLIALGAMLLG